jgi:integrase
MVKLTTIAVEQARAGAARREIPDGGCPGLYLVIQPNGTKSWAVRYRAPSKLGGDGQRAPRKLTLGSVATISLKAARAAATDALKQVEAGNDPAVDKVAAKAAAKADAIAARDNTVDATMVEFLTKYRGKNRQGIRESTRHYTAALFGLKMEGGEWKPTGKGVLAKWKGRPIASVTKQDARSLIEGIAADHPVLGNRTLTGLKTFFGWAVKQDLLALSPVAALDAPAAETERQRTLTPDEIKSMWNVASAEAYPFGTMAKLLMMTGVRRDEAREAKWSEFDLDARTWLIPAERSKNRREHLVPLSPEALAVLRNMPRIKGCPWVFTTTGTTPISGLSKALDRLRGDGDWTWHDLRRTFYTGLQGLKIPIEVAEVCVNHRGGTLGGLARVYGTHDYWTEKTAAFEAWARHVDGLVNGRAAAGDNVVRLHEARQ